MKLRTLFRIIGLLSWLPGVALAGSIRLEGERLDGRVYNLGGADAVTRPCGEASGGFAMAGLDLDGEYVEFKFSVETKYYFSDSIRADGLPGNSWQFRLEIVPQAGGDPVLQSLYPATIGHGVSCPVQFEEVSSGEVHFLEAGEYWLRVVRVGEGDTRLDWLELWDAPTPAVEISWSRVKALFDGP